MKVFFDVDGVLIRGWHAKPERRRPWDATIGADLGIDGGRLRSLLFGGEPLAGPYHDCAVGRRDLKEVLGGILPRTGYRGTVDDFVRYWFEHDSVLHDDVLDAVRRLGTHGHVELYLCTAQEHHRAAYLWNDLNFRNYFRDIWYTARMGHPKTTVPFFAAINAALKVSADERPIFFDDAEEVVAAARDAGWDAHVFDSVDDLHRHPRVRPLL